MESVSYTGGVQVYSFNSVLRCEFMSAGRLKLLKTAGTASNQMVCAKIAATYGLVEVTVEGNNA